MSIAPVKVPRELLAVQQTVLEEYVRNRLLQFIRGFGTRVLQLAPDLHPTLLDRAVRDVLEVLPQPDYGLVPVDMLELQLVFRHDCLCVHCRALQMHPKAAFTEVRWRTVVARHAHQPGVCVHSREVRRTLDARGSSLQCASGRSAAGL
eukprot:GHRQ01030933.1.p1 GENE.GHRQ01030933.1~~GHRQ01030933.1.p1  ORF type:complete len:149 (+),score=24.55 GHRQ01030933.1:165-611(+)